MKRESRDIDVKKMKIDQEIYGRILKSNPKKKEEWKYKFCPDYYYWIFDKYGTVDSDIEYEKSWIETARKMIQNEKYKTIPADVLDSIHFDGEEDNGRFGDSGEID